jgi:type III secretion protein J
MEASLRFLGATDHSGTSNNRSRIPTWVRLTVLAACAVVLSACNVELFANLEQRQANEIVATLYRRGIPAERVPEKGGRYAIKVDGSAFAQAVAILNENGLPRQEFATMCEVFKKDGWAPFEGQARALTICAVSQELSRTVSEIDGVLSAHVHLVLPENDLRGQSAVPSSASVFIRHKNSVHVADLVPQVKQLVANGVSGLGYDKVSLTLIPVDVPQEHIVSAPSVSEVLGVTVVTDSALRAYVLIYGLLFGLIGAVIALLYTMRGGNNVYPLNKDNK